MAIEPFQFWLRSVAQIITSSRGCYNLRNGTQPKLKIFFCCNFFYHLGHCGGDTVFVLSECSQDNSRSNGPIYMKFGGMVDIHTRTNRLDFGAT